MCVFGGGGGLREKAGSMLVLWIVGSALWFIILISWYLRDSCV